MKTKLIDLPKGKKISHIMNFLPSNALINKTIPGCGATHAEIYCERHSLIAFPNVPVIIGKVAKANKDGFIVLGVYEKTTLQDVINYLKSDIKYKKILTTPEAYLRKVKPAFIKCGINPFTDFYFLYDESEKTIQDVGYRNTIVEPLDDFFLYINKGFISATPIMPSDPRFTQKKFIRYVIKPTYDYAEPFNLHISNNVVLSVKDYLVNNEADHYSFFMNSTDGIYSLIKYLGIASQCQVFCAKKSVTKLNALGFANAYTELMPLKKYNFYTSRYFSAVDIEVDAKPDVIILTDLFFAEHTIIDPATEAIQIMGRFRNGVNKITHITNVNSSIKHQSREAIQHNLNGQSSSFSSVKMLYISAEEEVQRISFKQALEAMSYVKYVNKTTYLTNHFLIDNRLDEDMVKSYYSSRDRLIEAFERVKNFKLTITHSEYPLSDEDRFKRTYPKDNPELFKTIVEQMEHLHTNEFPYQIDNRNTEISNLIDTYPDLCNAYFKLGLAAIRKAGYKQKKVKALLKTKDQKDKPIPFPAIGAFNNAFKFKLDLPSSTTELGEIGSKLKKQFNLPGKVLHILQLMFDVSDREQKTINGSRVWTRILSNPKFIVDE
ncbi:hypothetical protein [Mucilaginibacter panaciglaebae]|uniref:Uncharacterized protein n=1 Tax=Mucilaginibacter panaciglaebae TaxID=502331 RepID=A0ABP7WZZ9_9SPHI